MIIMEILLILLSLYLTCLSTTHAHYGFQSHSFKVPVQWGQLFPTFFNGYHDLTNMLQNLANCLIYFLRPSSWLYWSFLTDFFTANHHVGTWSDPTYISFLLTLQVLGDPPFPGTRGKGSLSRVFPFSAVLFLLYAFPRELLIKS